MFRSLHSIPRAARRGQDTGRYLVYSSRWAAKVGVHLRWVVSSLENSVVEVGDYETAVAIASELAAVDAHLSGTEFEVVVEAFQKHPARRIVFRGKDTPVESLDGTAGSNAA